MIFSENRPFLVLHEALVTCDTGMERLDADQTGQSESQPLAGRLHRWTVWRWGAFTNLSWKKIKVLAFNRIKCDEKNSTVPYRVGSTWGLSPPPGSERMQALREEVSWVWVWKVEDFLLVWKQLKYRRIKRMENSRCWSIFDKSEKQTFRLHLWWFWRLFVLFRRRSWFGSNFCGDFVLLFRFLNCKFFLLTLSWLTEIFITFWIWKSSKQL